MLWQNHQEIGKQDIKLRIIKRNLYEGTQENWEKTQEIRTKRTWSLTEIIRNRRVRIRKRTSINRWWGKTKWLRSPKASTHQRITRIVRTWFLARC